jgi:hypothetical protein
LSTGLDNAGARLRESVGEAVARMTRQRHPEQASP